MALSWKLDKEPLERIEQSNKNQDEVETLPNQHNFHHPFYSLSFFLKLSTLLNSIEEYLDQLRIFKKSSTQVAMYACMSRHKHCETYVPRKYQCIGLREDLGGHHVQNLLKNAFSQYYHIA